MECKFYVGQKVVCVDADGSRALRLGSVYTIARIDPPEIRLWRERARLSCTVWLCEATPSLDNYGFAPERFRPAVETQTDISALRQIVADVMAGRVREAV